MAELIKQNKWKVLTVSTFTKPNLLLSASLLSSLDVDQKQKKNKALILLHWIWKLDTNDPGNAISKAIDKRDFTCIICKLAKHTTKLSYSLLLWNSNSIVYQYLLLLSSEDKDLDVDGHGQDIAKAKFKRDFSGNIFKLS